MKPIIGYDSEIPDRFPQLSWACILIEGVSNEPSPMALTAKMRLAELEVREALQSTPIAEIPAVGDGYSALLVQNQRSTAILWKPFFDAFRKAKPCLPSVTSWISAMSFPSVAECHWEYLTLTASQLRRKSDSPAAMNTSPTLGQAKPITQKWERWCSLTPMAS